MNDTDIFLDECDNTYEFSGKTDFFELINSDQKKLIGAFIEKNYLKNPLISFEIIGETDDANELPKILVEFFKGRVSSEYLGEYLAAATKNYLEEVVVKGYEEYCQNRKKKESSCKSDNVTKRLIDMDDDEAAQRLMDIDSVIKRLSDYNNAVINDLFGGR